MSEILEMFSVIQDNFMHISMWMFPVIFFMAALFYFLLRKEKTNVNFVYLGLGVFIVWLLPFAANNITTFFVKEAFMYGKVLFIIPIVAFVCYAFTEFYYHEIKQKKQKRVWFFLFVVLLVQTGYRFDYDFSVVQTRIDLKKVPEEVEEIAGVLEPFPSKCVAPKEVASTIKEVGISTNVLYGNYVYDTTNVKEMVKTADAHDCNVIIMKKEDDDAEYLKKKGFEHLLETEHYQVYVYLDK